MNDMAVATGRAVEVNGTAIHYEEQGRGEPLLLLHGGLISANSVWSSTPGAWVPHMAAFTQHFRVIAPDPEGTAGRSTPVAAQSTVGLPRTDSAGRPRQTPVLPVATPHQPHEEDLQPRVLPDGCIDIVWIGGEPTVVVGPATMTAMPSFAPDTPIAGIRFRTGLAPCLLGLPASEVRDIEAPLDNIWDVNPS